MYSYVLSYKVNYNIFTCMNACCLAKYWFRLCIKIMQFASFCSYMQKYFIQPGRSRRDCPIPGCNSKRLKRLPNHLKEVHRLTGQEKKKWLQMVNHVSQLLGQLMQIVNMTHVLFQKDSIATRYQATAPLKVRFILMKCLVIQFRKIIPMQ